jgi:hypothetical protein
VLDAVSLPKDHANRDKYHYYTHQHNDENGVLGYRFVEYVVKVHIVVVIRLVCGLPDRSQAIVHKEKDQALCESRFLV